MDRDRLKDVHTADLAEARTNEEFVVWLKTKAPTYLLVVMVVIVGYLFLIRYRQGQTAHRAEAWVAYLEAGASGLPASLEDVAVTYSDVDAIHSLGLLSAGDGYMRAIAAGIPVGDDPTTATELSAEDRLFYLDKADALYAGTVSSDDGSMSMELLVYGGLSGRAAVAEARDDLEAAKAHYLAAADRVQEHYPALAAAATTRADQLSNSPPAATLPTDADVAARNQQVLRRDPRVLDETIDQVADPDS
jgi:hypothetical protein